MIHFSAFIIFIGYYYEPCSPPPHPSIKNSLQRHCVRLFPWNLNLLFIIYHLMHLSTFLLSKGYSTRLCYFTMYESTIRDPTMHDSCINYPNMLKLRREKYEAGKLSFPKCALLLYVNTVLLLIE